MHGGDSSIVIEAISHGNQHWYDYDVAATYNQGSTKGNNLIGLIISSPLVTLAIILYSSFIVYYVIFLNRRQRKEQIRRLQREIVYIRGQLKEEPDSEPNKYVTAYWDARKHITNMQKIL